MLIRVSTIVHVNSEDGCLAGIVSNTDPITVTIFPKHGPQLEASRRIPIDFDTETLDKLLHDPETCDSKYVSW